MKFSYFVEDRYAEYPIAVLNTSITQEGISKEYLDPFNIDKSSVFAVSTPFQYGKKKLPKAEILSYVVQELIPLLTRTNTKFVICGDGEVFKVLTGAAKTTANIGYVLKSLYGDLAVVYVPNFRAVFHKPDELRASIAQSINALKSYVEGSYEAPGENILHFEEYPETDEEIQQWLDKLLSMGKPLTIDTEAFDLKHYKAGLGSISFAWSKHEGIAFLVDYVPTNSDVAPFGQNIRNQKRREMLKKFFIDLQVNVTYHNISFDAYLLIYQLFMDDLNDQAGLLEGLSVMLRDWDDTKLISYLATNTCAGNELSLKEQAQEFAGNYAQDDIKDITKIPPDVLLRYNLVDSCSTWFVKEKHTQKMLQDMQGKVYVDLFKPAIADIIQMQLTGMPLHMERVIEVKGILEADSKSAADRITQSPIVQNFIYTLNKEWVQLKNSTYKKKRVSLLDAKEKFNPNSPIQLQRLLYEELGLPILERTDSKQPATGKGILKSLKEHAKARADAADVLALLDALIDFKDVEKILTAFIPAMLDAPKGKDGWHYLFGSFNLGGTVSGRLSSSNINLQQLPASGRYAKLIKSCFMAPPGWLFVGLDFASLEDRISALTTKDPNKLKVYTDGYDGHCLRAFSYFGNQMPGIVDTVESINSIADLFPTLRGLSKAPTFAMTYQGTYVTLMKNCGFSEEQAKDVEKRYHELYKVSTEWINKKLDQASIDGYVTGAFGLRVRTPLLKQVIRGTTKTPYEAEAEGRTAGNALGQSWCLLNTRAASEFMGKVRASKYASLIKPCAQIHDAQYYLIPEDLGALMFVNEHLVEAVKWQDHPDIAHPDVGLGGEVSVFYPHWGNEIEIPNGATEEQVLLKIDKALNDYYQKAAGKKG